MNILQLRVTRLPHLSHSPHPKPLNQPRNQATEDGKQKIRNAIEAAMAVEEGKATEAPSTLELGMFWVGWFSTMDSSRSSADPGNW